VTLPVIRCHPERSEGAEAQITFRPPRSLRFLRVTIA